MLEKIRTLNPRTIIISILLLFLVLRVPALFKDLAVEEGSFIKTGEAMIEKGIPEIYIGELRQDIINFDKPPLTRIMIAAGYKLTGNSLWGARLVPFLFALLQFILIIFLIDKLYKGKNKKYVLYGSLIFYSLMPLAIHAAGEIQIDYIISFFLAIYMFSAFSVLNKEKNRLNSYPILFLGIFLSFASKYEPALMAVFILNIYMILKRVGFKKIFIVNLISLGAIIAYLGIFYIYTIIAFGDSTVFLEAYYVIENVITSFFIKKFEGGGIPDPNHFKTNLTLFRGLINFISLPIFLLFISSSVSKRIKDNFISFNVLTVTIFTLIYLAVGWVGLGFPRYFGPILISLVFLVSLHVEPVVGFVKKNKAIATLITSIALVWFITFYEGLRSFFFINDISLMLKLLAGFGVVYLFLKLFKNKYLYNLLSFIFILYFIFFAVFHIKNDVFSNKIVTASYGQRGVSDVVEFLHSKLDPATDLILANDNIGFTYGEKYYFWNVIYPYPDKLEIYLTEGVDQTKAFIIPQAQIDQYPQIVEHIKKNDMQKQTIGSFDVYL